MNRHQVDQLYNIALWYQQLRDTSNEAFMPLYFDEHRYLVLKGGGGSGKSIFAGRKVLERVSSEPGHRYLVVRKVARTLRESCFEQLKSQAYQYYSDKIAFIPRGKSSDMFIKFRNGSEILFAGLDDVEKLKSIYDITGIWIEEASELLESDFNQLDIRLRTDFPQYLQIILTFNPISIQHWLKKRFFDYDIKDAEVMKKTKARTRTHESTYKDNRFLTKDAIETLEAFKEIDEYYYQVYCLGMWGTTGKSVFNSKEITRRLADNVRPIKTGFFDYDYDGLTISNIRWVDDEDYGYIQMYKEPEAGVPYVLGGDTAGNGGDRFVAQVIDNRSGRQVCKLRHRFDEDLYAKQVYCLGTYYNTALVGIETNFSTYPNRELERLNYPNLYVRESVDTYTHEMRRSFGFETNSKTRPLIISELIKVTREDMDIVCDNDTLSEMLTFVRGEDWKPQAENGANDDCVMALAIAHFIRPQQAYTADKLKGEAVTWTQSQWEDYYSASPSEQEYLRKKWGDPIEAGG